MATGKRVIISVTTSNIYSAAGSQHPVGTCTTTVYIQR
jgi:hypothetical protein